MAGRWLILADDLTGAADCAIAFKRRGLAAAVTWDIASTADAKFQSVLSYDADSRGLSAQAAAERHGCLLERLLEPDRSLFKKIDSTLRGQPAAEAAATIAYLMRSNGTAFGICAPAFPATGRTTVSGHVLVNGRPLEDAEVWKRDRSYASADLAVVFGTAGIRTEAVSLALVRGPDLADCLARIAAARDVVAICDAETDEDLARIAVASLSVAPCPFFIGSAGLAHALAGTLDSVATATVRIPPRAGGSLIVVGSLAAASRAATRRLAARDGIAHLPVSPETLLRDAAGRAALAARVAAVIAAGDDALVEITLGDVLDMTIGPRLARSLAEALDPIAARIGAVAATGGETAAALLARFGIDGIRLVDEIEPGVSLGLTLGRLSIPVATKAGAFGDAESLIRISERLRAVRTQGSFS